ncbi:unnamed protein product [Clavelina lepadiformis]|uniref:Uncharacterized protein n=2 Tax=Clavelina lepadiformis TaxID=159417 RepID=A0ABP0FSF4_CLALP
MHPRTGRNLSGFLKIPALGFFISSQCSMQWFVTDITSIGLYRSCQELVNQPPLCGYLPWQSSLYYDSFLVARIMFLVAAVFIVCSLGIQMSTWCANLKKLKSLLLSEGGCDITAGLILMAAMITFTVMCVESPLTTLPRWKFGWCYAFGWCAATDYLFAGIVEVMAGKSKLTEDEIQEREKLNSLQEKDDKKSDGHYNTTSN